MKYFLIPNSILIILSLITISCSTSTNVDEEKVKSAFLKSRGFKTELVSFTEIKLIRNITAQDSINILLKASDEIIKDHDATMQKINEWTELKEKEANSYSQWDHDSYIKKFTDELNMFTDAYEGKFSDETWKYYYTYSKLYRLRKMDPTKIVGRIYSITYIMNKKTQMQVWLFDSEITATIGGILSEEDTMEPEQRDIEKIHFERYEFRKNEDIPDAEFIHEGGDMQEFDGSGNSIK